jgi:hypothetical protein
LNARQKHGFYLVILCLILVGGVALILWNEGASAAVGTSLVASGLVGLLDLFYKYITTGEEAGAVEIRASGLRAVSSRRDLDRYHTLMSSLSSRLDIAGYSLRNFNESFGDILFTKLQADAQLRARLLLVNPKSPRSQEREQLEGLHAPQTFEKSVDSVVRRFGTIRNAEVRLLDGDLTTMIFRIDNTMFVGPQFISKASRSTVTFELEKAEGKWLFDQFEREFEAMWTTARQVN